MAVSMIAVLAGALIYYNFIDGRETTVTPPVETEESTSEPDGTNDPNETEAPAMPKKGTEVGNECYGMTLPYIGQDDGFNLTENRGKITVLNFWGTWCGPCKAELPYFDRIATEYADSVQVVTIHSAYGLDKSEAYISENYPDSQMLFTYDEGEGFYYLLINATAWPATVILDENGIILYKFIGSVEYETLQTVIDTINENETPTDVEGYDALIDKINQALSNDE